MEEKAGWLVELRCGCAIYLCEDGTYELYGGGILLETSDDIEYIRGYARRYGMGQ